MRVDLEPLPYVIVCLMLKNNSLHVSRLSRFFALLYLYAFAFCTPVRSPAFWWYSMQLL